MTDKLERKFELTEKGLEVAGQLEADELRESVASYLIVLCEDCLHGEHLKNDCPHLDEDVCLWQREIAAQIIPIVREATLKEVVARASFTVKLEGDTVIVDVIDWHNFWDFLEGGK